MPFDRENTPVNIAKFKSQLYKVTALKVGDDILSNVNVIANNNWKIYKTLGLDETRDGNDLQIKSDLDTFELNGDGTFNIALYSTWGSGFALNYEPVDISNSLFETETKFLEHVKIVRNYATLPELFSDPISLTNYINDNTNITFVTAYDNIDTNYHGREPLKIPVSNTKLTLQTKSKV